MHFKLCVFLYTFITPLKTLLTDSQEAKNIYISSFSFPIFSIDFPLVPQLRIQRLCNRVVPSSSNIRFNYVQAWDRGRVFATKLQWFNCRKIVVYCSLAAVFSVSSTKTKTLPSATITGL